ncbi:MAG TPA: dihydrofolate reductase family protein [Nitrospiraceae bacterium]
MRKVIASPYMSLDGLIALPDGTSDWPVSGSERYAREVLPMLFEQSDTIVLGRKTYETIVQFWPSMSPEEDRFATPMNTLPKIVFSQSLKEVPWGKWQNATLVKDDPVEAMLALKQQEGKDLLIFGSGRLISTLAQADLIDDYWLQVHPVALGSGVSLFSDLERRLDLSLLEARPSEEGVLILHYQKARKAA